jgi:hypothetical protein
MDASIKQPLSIHRIASGFFAVALFVIFLLTPFAGKMRGFFDTGFRCLVPQAMELPLHFNRGVNWYPVDLVLISAVGVLMALRLLPLRPLLRERPLLLMGGVFGVALLSIAFSEMARYPLQYVQLCSYACAPLFLLLIVRSRRWIEPRQLMTLCSLALVCGGVIQAVIALAQYVTQQDVGLYRLGEAPRWFFPFRCSFVESGVLFRASGTLSHPNCLGAFLMSTLLCTLYCYLRKCSSRILMGSACLVQLAGLFVSFSRSAFLATGFALLCFTFLMMKVKQVEPRLALLARRSVVCVLAVAALGVIAFFPALKERGGIIGYNQTTQSADLERMDYVKVAIEEIKQHPLLGVGFNNFALYSPILSEALTGRILHLQVHNIYLLIAAEIGLVGFALFAAFILSVLRAGLKKLFADTAYPIERVFLVSIFLGLLAIGMTDFFLWWTAAGRFLFFGIAGLVYAVSSQEVARVKTL